MMTSEENLKAKVFELLRTIPSFGMDTLDKLIKSGVGIVEDHESNECNYAIAKDFIIAFARELECQYARPTQTRKDIKRIKNYNAFM